MSIIIKKESSANGDQNWLFHVTHAPKLNYTTRSFEDSIITKKYAGLENIGDLELNRVYDDLDCIKDFEVVSKQSNGATVVRIKPTPTFTELVAAMEKSAGINARIRTIEEKVLEAVDMGITFQYIQTGKTFTPSTYYVMPVYSTWSDTEFEKFLTQKINDIKGRTFLTTLKKYELI